MSDIFGMETYGASPDRANGDFGTVPSTGDLRRKYNFGDRISELSIAQDPFFRFVSQVAKKNQQMILSSNLLNKDILIIRDMHM